MTTTATGARGQDFLFIARAIDEAHNGFQARVRGALSFALGRHPEITLRASFDLGPREHVEVFSAPTPTQARQLAEEMKHAAAGFRAEVVPLYSEWQG